MWNRRQIWIRHILQIVRRCPWIIYQSLAGPSRLGIPRTAMCQVKLRTSQWEAGALSELDRWRQFQPIKELGECPTSLSILAWLERCKWYPTVSNSSLRCRWVWTVYAAVQVQQLLRGQWAGNSRNSTALFLSLLFGSGSVPWKTRENSAPKYSTKLTLGVCWDILGILFSRERTTSFIEKAEVPRHKYERLMMQYKIIVLDLTNFSVT